MTDDETMLQSDLIAALQRPEVFGPDCAQVRVLQTHISWILLTGQYAYKIKKAVVLPFLDFSSLASRRFYCEEELRLNRRLAPHLYLGLVPITGTPANPVLGGAGPAIEYAIKMAQFPQDALLSVAIEHGDVGATDIDALAALVADFHGRIAVAEAGSGFGAPQDILSVADDNFAAIGAGFDAEATRELARLRDWTHREFGRRQELFSQRQQRGFIRECHGDMHLANIIRVNGVLTVFDCIEFNESFRWIDTAAEIAFTAMDLTVRKHPELAYRFLNAYLEATGDYDALGVLQYYLVYRAMVRAKVTYLRALQLAPGAERAEVIGEFRDYLALASDFARPRTPALIVTHGLSGSGKTTFTQVLLDHLGAVRVRTDVERHRLYGLSERRYDADVTRSVYQRVCDLARLIIGTGRVAIVDAACLASWQRQCLRELARELGVPFVLLSFVAPADVLRQRVSARSAIGADASEADLAVLEGQLQRQEPLSAAELRDTLIVDAQRDPAFMGDPEFLARLSRSLKPPAPSTDDEAATPEKPAADPGPTPAQAAADSGQQTRD